DLRLLLETVQVRLNLELALDPEMLTLALQLRPGQITFVPERRAEVTTEGGLDVVAERRRVDEALARCRDAGIEAALFIDPSSSQVEAAAQLGARSIELHRGRYADATTAALRRRELEALRDSGALAVASGLELHAGHGLNYQNVLPVARIDRMEELNIGHSIVSRAIFVGMKL